MALRRSVYCSLFSLGVLAACDAEKTFEGTSLGGGEPTSPSPTGGSQTGENGGPEVNPPVGPEGPILPATEFVQQPLPTGGGQGATADAGPPEIETMVNQNCAQTKVTATDTTVLVPADIIIAVDTSSSMLAETGFVQDQLNAFSEQIGGSGIDARVILLAQAGEPGGTVRQETRDTFTMCIGSPLGSGNCPDDSKLPGYFHVDQFIDSRDSLQQFITSFPEWRDQLRPNSLKAFMVVTDDESNLDADSFVTQLEALDPTLFERWNMNGVFSFSLCQGLAERVGDIYADLVERTGGVSGDLCEQDFQPVFDRLATQIVENAGAELVCEWEIPPSVDGQTFSTELVEVHRTAANDGGTTSETLTRVLTADDCNEGGWYFDDNYNPTRIVACAATCEGMQDKAGGGIDVVFGCEVVEGCAASDETALGSGPTQEVSEDGGALVACEWPLPELEDRGQQLDLENVNVRYSTPNGFGILMGAVAGPADCTSVDLGWHYDDAAKPTKIVACPQTCEVLNSRQITQVQALFGCETRPARPRMTL